MQLRVNNCKGINKANMFSKQLFPEPLNPDHYYAAGWKVCNFLVNLFQKSIFLLKICATVIAGLKCIPLYFLEKNVGSERKLLCCQIIAL